MTMPSIPLAKAIAPSDTSTSIVIGGSGQGEQIAAAERNPVAAGHTGPGVFKRRGHILLHAAPV